MRLNKYLALCGVASRRKCDEYIAEGKVSVNSEVIIKLGFIIDESSDTVEFAGKKILLPTQYEYYLINKPRGIVCAAKPTKDERVVVDLIDTSARIFPVGRLDKDSEGLLILTNDGLLTQKLTHPSYEKEKKYLVTVGGRLTNAGLSLLKKGVPIDGYVTSPARVHVLEKNDNGAVFEITIHEGHNRQIRKMCEYIGCRVTKLVRTEIDGISDVTLKSGCYRTLTKDEIAGLGKVTKK